MRILGKVLGKKPKIKIVFLLIVFLSVFFLRQNSHEFTVRKHEGVLTHERTASHDTEVLLNKSENSLSVHGTKYILLNTYMRAGSTILGSLLGHHDDAFYFYEPLQRIHTYRYINGTQLCDYTAPFCRESPLATKESIQLISDIFNCRLRRNSKKYSPSIHLQGGHLGLKWKAFQTCRKNSTQDKCLGVMETVCTNSSYHVIKALRFQIRDVAELLKEYPNLYIFQLLRDPRAIINSHIYTGWYPLRENNIPKIQNDAAAQCRRLRDDIRYGKQLMARYPDRLRLLQYEDFAKDIMKIRSLYKLIGVDRLPGIETFVNNTARKKFDGRKVSKDSSIKFPKYFGYRDSLSFSILRTIQDQCEDVIRDLGFGIYRTEEELRDPGINSILSSLPFEIPYSVV